MTAKNIKVIMQGNAVDYSYVIERGACGIYGNPLNTVGPNTEGLGNKVNPIKFGGASAATVISTKPSTLGPGSCDPPPHLDDFAFQQCRMYESL